MQHTSLSLPPRTILGRRADGRPIYNIAGGDGTADAAAAATATDTGTGTAANGQQAATTGQQATGSSNSGTAAGTQAAAPAEWDGKVESLPPAVRKLIDDARAEAGKARVTAKEQAANEARDELLKKLGLKPDGSEEVDPEKLAAQLASRDAQLLSLQRETAAAKAARKQNADVDALLDRRSFVESLDGLDPASDKFDAEVDDLVKKALEKDPKLKQAQAAGVSGGQFTGGSGEGKQRPTSIGAALSAAAAKS